MDWQQRVDAVWGAAGEVPENETVAAIDALVAERAADDPDALFESASARDFEGSERDAEPLYRRALDLGIAEPSRGRAVIQLASTLRNLGRYDEAYALLTDEFGDAPDHPLADAAAAFLALVLVSRGDAVGGAAMALDALSRHLPQYRNAVHRYSVELLE